MSLSTPYTVTYYGPGTEFSLRPMRWELCGDRSGKNREIIAATVLLHGWHRQPEGDYKLVNYHLTEHGITVENGSKNPDSGNNSGTDSGNNGGTDSIPAAIQETTATMAETAATRDSVDRGAAFCIAFI